MKKLFCAVLAVVCLSACNRVAVDSGLIRKVRNTAAEFTERYSVRFNDADWENESAGRLIHPAFRQASAIPEKLKDYKPKLAPILGLNIYVEYSLKDTVVVQENAGYILRYDYKIAAVLKNSELRVPKPVETVSQFLWLAEDESDGLYKIIDAYPPLDQTGLILKETFIDNYRFFTSDAEIKRRVESLK